MRTLLGSLILFLLYLAWERVALMRAQRRIPLRIAVSGTRGKSGVARLLASILKQDGRRVVTKTTGSEAVVILPDGARVELERSVSPSILEQKNLVHRAARLRADALVAEVMSLRPENHYVETTHLLSPNIVAITNVRRDHTELMGETEDKIASVLSLDICRNAAVFIPSEVRYETFKAEARRRKAALIPVDKGSSGVILQGAPDLAAFEFTENLDLVCAIAGYLGIGARTVIEGIRNVQHDVGGLNVWRHPDRSLYYVNAFAANDPESTLQVLAKTLGMLPRISGVIGVFNLRADRLPRTMQWISVLNGGESHRFSRLFLTGEHTRVIRRQLPEAQPLKVKSPELITEAVCRGITGPAMIFGFGNVKGTGKSLIEHWARIGEPI